MSDKDLGRILAMCRELPLIEHRLRECGLMATAAMMNKVVVRAGYEAAEIKAAMDSKTPTHDSDPAG